MTNVATREKGEAAYGAPVGSGIQSYLLSAICVALAFLLRLGLDPLWKDRLPYIPAFLAVFVVTQFTDAGPSVFAIVAGFLLADWFFVPPRHSLLISDPFNQFNAVFYFVICSVVLFFSVRARRALAREQAARAALGRLAAIIESSDDAIVAKSLDGKIVSWNAGAHKIYGYTEAEAVGQPIALIEAPGSGSEFEPLLERVGRGEHVTHFETTRRRKDGEVVDVSLSISPVRNGAGEIVGASTIARDISDRKRSERERERLAGELQMAVGEVKTLSGLLPICAHCKKIRDDKGYWNQIELYLREHSSASFTHSICPECSRTHFAELFEDKPQDS
jgi:PAS domain S-box-containing protein